MGYYTQYSLKMEPDITEAWIQLRQNEEFAYAIDSDGSTSDSTKWYDHEIDMKEMSLRFPGVLFTLSGIGEESPDIWKKYFRGGKVQVENGRVIIDEFDPSKLR